ncbi:EAL domain-containing protein [Vibrio splendidus]
MITFDAMPREYQPICDLVTGRLKALEMLIRPETEDVGQYVKDIERANRITELDLSNIQHALTLIKSNALPVPVSVNVSGRSLSDPAFCKDVMNLLRSHKHGNKLNFEITETEPIANCEQASSFMIDVQSYGVTISADDFGSGHMTLDMVKRLPFNYIKLDGSLTQNLQDPLVKETILELVNMKSDKSFEIVAEYVQNHQEVRQLRELGVDRGQGYFYSQPVPLERFQHSS